MQTKDLLNSPMNNLDSHINKMMIYRDKRHIIRDQGNRENIRDKPDITDVKMVPFEIFHNQQLSDQHINVGLDMEEMNRRDLELKTSIIDKINKTSILLTEQQNKMKNGYEGYIEELEKENLNLKIYEQHITSIKDDLRLLEEQQAKYKSELQILSQKKGADPLILQTLRQRIKDLQTEKLQLLDLVNMNKTKIDELIKRVHNNQRDIFPDRSMLLREIESLETELEKKTFITEEKVIYKEVPLRQQQEIIEEVIEYEPPVDTRQYNSDCVCQCKCDCHTKHCHGYSQHHHNNIHSQNIQTQKTNSVNYQTKETLHRQERNVFYTKDIEVPRTSTVRRSFSRKIHVVNVQEKPAYVENAQRVKNYVKSYKNSDEEGETRSTSVIGKRSIRRMNNSIKTTRRSKSRRKQVFDMVNNRRKFIEDDKMFMEQSLDFHNYKKLMR